MARHKSHFAITMTVAVKQGDLYQMGDSVLKLEEVVTIPVNDFPGVGKVLQAFHQAYEQFRKLNKKEDED